MKRSISLGIVVAELMANSYEHAFPAGEGQIELTVCPNPAQLGEAVMTITDNGTGFTPSAESKRHGLGLVRRLVEEVRGTVSVASDRGTSWRICFPTPQLATAPRSAVLMVRQEQGFGL